MCCFSGPVGDVYGTSIFARSAAPGRQYLAYQMTYQSDTPVAMILPLPVRTPARERGTVRFLDLSGYPTFFGDLHTLCTAPPPPPPGVRSVRTQTGSMPALEVIEVGDYVASFVPTMTEFKRLDKRFVLPEKTWATIPAYRDYGFAVFQLKPSPSGTASRVHPMALEFATRLPPGDLFFPTVHIHDGRVHPTEEFDHFLYLQYPARRGAGPPRLSGVPEPRRKVTPAYYAAGKFVKLSRTKGLVSAQERTAMARLHGELPNRDVIVSYRA